MTALGTTIPVHHAKHRHAHQVQDHRDDGDDNEHADADDEHHPSPFRHQHQHPRPTVASKVASNCATCFMICFAAMLYFLNVQGAFVVYTQVVGGTSGGKVLRGDEDYSAPSWWRSQIHSGKNEDGDVRELTFLHIPLTGGDVIVRAALEEDASWGECLFGTKLLYDPEECPPAESDVCEEGAPWPAHLPMTLLNCNPYLEKDVFVVVRNPYDKWVSEYYDYCTRQEPRQCNADRIHTAEYMNEWIQKELRLRQKCTGFPDKCYYRHQNHNIPQYDYVYDTTQQSRDSSNAVPRRLVRWVLHYENLQEEFNDLMERYDLDIRLTELNTEVGEEEEERMTAVGDLTEETLSMVAEVYQQDFEAFGYSSGEASGRSRDPNATLPTLSALGVRGELAKRIMVPPDLHRN